MSKVLDIGTLEGRMCGHLAASLCRFFSGPAGKKGGFVMRTCPSDWEAAERALLDIGVMHMEQVGADRPLTMAVFSMDADEMPDFLAASIGNGDPRIARLIETFVAIACGGYEQFPLPESHDWFKPPPHYESAMRWLAHHGYAERNGEMFRWTEAIGPAMRAWYLWTDDGQPLADAETARLDEESRLAWSSMPDTLKRAIKLNRISFNDLVKALALGWRDGQWRAYTTDEHFELSGQLALARRIIELADREG